MHLQIIGWQFLFKILLQGQLLSLYASECWDLFMLHNTKWWMQKWNAWGKSTVKLNSNIVVTVMSENSQCCYTQTLLRLKTCFCFFSFNKFKMQNHIAPSHSCTSSVWGQRYGRWWRPLGSCTLCVLCPWPSTGRKSQGFYIALRNGPAEHSSLLLHNPES